MSNLNNLIPISKLNPFARFCCTIGNLPSSYMASLTYEEQLMWFCDYLKNTVIPAVNQNAEALVELQNYMANLDVQDEINNKLDDMAESGQLQEIITSYLQISGVMGYNILYDLKNANNLIEGSFAMTFGKISYNDGLGAFYKIRTITSGDVVDNENIVPLNFSNTLIAEKQHNKDIENINENLANLNIHSLTELVVFGDSWSMNNYPYFDNQNSMWNKIVAKRLNLNLHNYAISGAGFTVTGNTILSQVNTAVADTNLDKNKVKYVIYFGGINDLNVGSWSTLDELKTAIETCFNTINSNFPKSNIIIAGCNCFHHLINGVNHTTTSVIDIRNALLEKAQEFGFAFIDTTPFLLGQPNTIGSETGHPTEIGEKILGSKILSGINGTPYSPIKTNITPYIYNPTNPIYSENLTRILINGSPKSSNLMHCEIAMSFNGTTVKSGAYSFNFKEFSPSLNKKFDLYQGLLRVGVGSVVGDGTIYIYFDNTTLPNQNVVNGYFDIEI